jgi:hypothetical protein
MTRLLNTFAFFVIVFLFSCNQKPSQDFLKAESPNSPQNPTVDARLYLLYSDISKDSNDLQKLVSSKKGGEKLVFQSYFKPNGQLALVAYSGKKNQADYDTLVSVIDDITISDTGISYETISGTTLGNQELTKSAGEHSFESLKNYLTHQHAENYMVFIPHLEHADSSTNRKILTYLMVAVKNLPATKIDYEALLQLPNQKTELSLPNWTINPCPPRCFMYYLQ